MVALLARVEESPAAIASIEALADISESRSSAAARRHVWVKIIFYCDREIAGPVLSNCQANPAAFGQIRNSVRDSVFKQRLQEQRGHKAIECLGLYLFLEAEARTEADFFNRKKRLHEREFVLERDGDFLP